MKKSIALFLFISLSINIYCQTKRNANGNRTTVNEIIQTTEHFSKLKSINVINQIPSPIIYPNSLAFDGKDLWLSGYNEFHIFKISREDGSIIDSIEINLKEPHGMTFDGTYFYICDAFTDVIQKLDTQGQIISSIPMPTQQPSHCQGLTFDGSGYWLNDQREPLLSSQHDDITYIIDEDGLVLNQFNSIGDVPTGLAFDGTNIWSIDNGLDELHKIDPNTYRIVETFDTPESIPTGLAFDGQHLWLVDNGTDLIYQIDIGTLSNSEFQYDDLLKIFPNPANQYIYLDLNSSNKKAEIFIYNTNGKCLKTMKFENRQILQIDINDFQKGIYFIKINIDGALFTDKIIKN